MFCPAFFFSSLMMMRVTCAVNSHRITFVACAEEVSSQNSNRQTLPKSGSSRFGLSGMMRSGDDWDWRWLSGSRTSFLGWDHAWSAEKEPDATYTCKALPFEVYQVRFVRKHGAGEWEHCALTSTQYVCKGPYFPVSEFALARDALIGYSSQRNRHQENSTRNTSAWVRTLCDRRSNVAATEGEGHPEPGFETCKYQCMRTGY